MTRVSYFILIVLLASSQKIQQKANSQDPYYIEALVQLDNYTMKASNITHIIDLLEQSIELNNVDAMAKLAELYLIGIPTQSNNQFQRDFKKSIELFHKAHQGGNKDASFFLALILQQSLLVTDFDKYIPARVNHNDVLPQLLNSALDRGSTYARACAAAGYIGCIHNQDKTIPDYLKKDTDFATSGFKKKNCKKNCEKVANHALQLASDALVRINLKGHEEVIAERLDLTLDYLFGEKSDKAIMLSTELAQHSRNANEYYRLGKAYLSGDPATGIEANLEEALKYFILAAQYGQLDALNQLASWFAKGMIDISDISPILSSLNFAAKNLNSGMAWYWLGFFMINGIGGEKDVENGIQYLEKAAELGYSEGQNALGSLYANGNIVKKDYDKARFYLQKAADQGHTQALFNIGMMDLHGFGSGKSCTSALESFQKVLEKGELAKIMQRAYQFYRLGDYLGAYFSYMLAASLGYENAQLSAAYMWEQNMVPLHPRYDSTYNAASYYSLATLTHASQWANYKLGQIAFKDNQYTDALYFYERANSIPESLFNAGYMYENALGTEKNFTQALEYYQRIIEGSNLQWDEEAMYPATLALYKLRMLEFAEQVPIVGDVVKYLYEQMQQESVFQ